MNWLILLMQLLPSIVKLMGIAEEAFDKTPDSGKKKKEMVMGATAAILGGIAGVSTGGQAETWKRIAKPVSGIIDNAAAIAFPHEDIGGP